MYLVPVITQKQFLRGGRCCTLLPAHWFVRTLFSSDGEEPQLSSCLARSRCSFVFRLTHHSLLSVAKLQEKEKKPLSSGYYLGFPFVIAIQEFSEYRRPKHQSVQVLSLEHPATHPKPQGSLFLQQSGCVGRPAPTSTLSAGPLGLVASPIYEPVFLPNAISWAPLHQIQPNG